MTTASARSFAGDHFVPRMLARQFDNDFPMEDAYKDILNVQHIAIEKRAMTPLVNAMTSSYQNAIAAGMAASQKAPLSRFMKRRLAPNLAIDKPANIRCDNLSITVDPGDFFIVDVKNHIARNANANLFRIFRRCLWPVGQLGS